MFVATHFATLVISPLSEALTVHEALSGIFGSISLATWIFLLVPQLLLNYRIGSADGISLAFLTVWLIGDITNLAGALWAGLVPTVITLAIYFCFADLVLISQCVYYNHINAKKDRKRLASVASAISEEEPLLNRRRSSDTTGLPGSHRRPSSINSHRHDTLSKILEEGENENESHWKKNVLSILAVILAGALGWAIAWQSGVWLATPEEGAGNGVPHSTQIAVGAQILGYVSAVCYLGARIPQIIKNYQEKSCSGLALLFFLLSLMGNASYGASILCHSLEKDYIWNNLPWLIGSLGTMAEDAIIFVQFRIYSKSGSESAIA